MPNDICPFCGERELKGTVEEIHGNVPLYDWGHNTVDADYGESDVTYIGCTACQKEVPARHYYEHTYPGASYSDNLVPCDCKEVGL